MSRHRAPAPHRCRVGNLALSAGLLRFEHCYLRVQLVHCRVFRADVSARRPRRGGGGGGGGTRSAGLSMRSLMHASSSANGTSLSSGAVGAGGFMALCWFLFGLQRGRLAQERGYAVGELTDLNKTKKTIPDPRCN